MEQDRQQMSAAEISEYVRRYINRQRRASYADHPERVMRQRIRSAANLLIRQGMIDEDTHTTIMERMNGGVKNG